MIGRFDIQSSNIEKHDSTTPLFNLDSQHLHDVLPNALFLSNHSITCLPPSSPLHGPPFRLIDTGFGTGEGGYEMCEEIGI